MSFAGLAVLADMFLTTHFMTLVLICIWRVPLPIVALWYFVFAPIEGTYLSATLEKIPTGAGKYCAQKLKVELIHITSKLFQDCSSPAYYLLEFFGQQAMAAFIHKAFVPYPECKAQLLWTESGTRFLGIPVVLQPGIPLIHDSQAV